MASMRAEAVAEVLWELKKVDKLATFKEVAQRAGFSAGARGRTIITCLENVKRDWPHLQWWRAVPDNCCLEAKDPQVVLLREAGYSLNGHPEQETMVIIVGATEVLYSWEDEAVDAAVASAE